MIQELLFLIHIEETKNKSLISLPLVGNSHSLTLRQSSDHSVCTEIKCMSPTQNVAPNLPLIYASKT